MQSALMLAPWRQVQRAETAAFYWPELRDSIITRAPRSAPAARVNCTA